MILLANEKIIYRSKWRMMGAIIGYGMLFAIGIWLVSFLATEGIFVGSIMLLIAITGYMQSRSKEAVITNRRIMIKTGISENDIKIIPLDKIDSVSIVGLDVVIYAGSIFNKATIKIRNTREFVQSLEASRSAFKLPVDVKNNL
jgi:5-bromo-4-chloroindolyl phosphate hydrolysis protein